MSNQLKIEAGKKYRTQGGHEVEVLRTDLVNNEEPIVGIATNKNGSQWAVSYYPNGSYFYDEESALDIISEIKPKRVVWVNVYEGFTAAIAHPSREDADEHADRDRIARVRVEFEEGQFDE